LVSTSGYEALVRRGIVAGNMGRKMAEKLHLVDLETCKGDGISERWLS